MKCALLLISCCIASFHIQITIGSVVDPCGLHTHRRLHDVDLRGTACGLQEKGVCDKRLEPGWYSAKGEEDVSYRIMAEGPVDMFWCGTMNPMYLLEGSHPSVAEDIVQRTVCVSGVNSRCERNFTIEIKNCSAFYVYNLTNTDECSVAYCFGIGRECPKPDPCEEKNHHRINVDDDRSTNCRNTDLQLCDLTLKSSWYRMQYKEIDVKMPDHCIAEQSCGTVHPIWLNGQEPTVDEKVVTLKACASMGDKHNCTCLKEYEIQLKNCTSYLVYNLTATKSCPERYCFGSLGTCAEKGREQDSGLTSPDFLKYIYGSVAAIVMTIALATLSFFLYRKIQRSNAKVDSFCDKFEEQGMKKKGMSKK